VTHWTKTKQKKTDMLVFTLAAVLAFQSYVAADSIIEVTSYGSTAAGGFCSGTPQSVTRVKIGECVDASFFTPGLYAIFQPTSCVKTTTPRAFALMSGFLNDSACNSAPGGIDAAVIDVCYPITFAPPMLYGGFFSSGRGNGTAVWRNGCKDASCRQSCASETIVKGVGSPCQAFALNFPGLGNLYGAPVLFAETHMIVDAVTFSDSSCKNVFARDAAPVNTCFGGASAQCIKL
jgi:hypothetical protein